MAIKIPGVPNLFSGLTRSTRARPARRINQRPSTGSRDPVDYGQILIEKLVAAGIPPPERELLFARKGLKRKWRIDLAWKEQRVALEIEGGSWTGGRHTRGEGFEGDIVKYNSAMLLYGYKLIRVTPGMIKSNTKMAEIVYWVEIALGIKPAPYLEV